MKVFEVLASEQSAASIRELAGKVPVEDVVIGARLDDGRRLVRIVVRDADQQKLVDELETALSGSAGWRIMILPLEATLPKPEAPETHESRRLIAAGLTREELYERVTKDLGGDPIFLVLACLSTIVTAFGLYEDSVTLVIGGMLISPLLNPSLALAFGAAIGDRGLMLRAVNANAAGLGVVLLLSILLGVVQAPDLASGQLAGRTNVGLDSVALALASGAAAALSITSGLSNALVGVLVAVAVLPPAVAAGLLLGAGSFGCAAGSGILLAVNIACVNLAAQAVFFVQGIRPRTWYEALKARHSARLNAVVWTALLITLLAILFYWQQSPVACGASR